MKKSLLRAFGGFTLIEIVVVISLLAVIVTIASNTFFSVLRGSTKTRTLQAVKQNGEYALMVMERMIRSARKIEKSTGSSLEILNPDGKTTVFRCCGASPNLLIASESGTLSCENARLTSNEVKVKDCLAVFTVSPGEAGVRPDVVKINFELSQAAMTTRIEEQALVNFQTTVSLRNY